MNKLKYLFNLEWKKFSGNTTTIVLITIFSIIAPFAILFGKDIFKDAGPPFPSPNVFYEFPSVWDYQGWIGTWLAPFIMGFMMIYMITSEVSNRTLRQNIITGMTRQDFFLGKVLSMIVLASYASLLYAISCIILGIIHTDGWDMELLLDNNFGTTRHFIMYIGYMSLAFLLSFLIKRGTLTILIYFFYVLMLEPILQALHVYYIRNASRNYWPANVFEDLSPLPLFKIPSFFVRKDWNFDFILNYQTAIGVSILYIAIFIFWSYRWFTRRDI
jgi:ABC-2 type transport system permease protein